MDTIFVFILFFALLLFSLSHGVSILYPLVAGLVCFVLLAARRGHPLKAIGRMIVNGAQKSLIVIKINVLIGAITAVWRACGTVSFIVYYGIAFMSAKLFIVSAFLLTCLVSFLLGTSFGTVGTVGVVLMILAKTGNVDINMAAGAVIAGAYFGDRCSPMSSSANLVATLTNTRLYTNIANMFQTAFIPLLLSVIAYTLLSWWNPLAYGDNQIDAEIRRAFQLGPVVLLPAVIILVPALFRVDVKISMALSILSGLFIGLFVQEHSVPEMARYIVWGYSMEGGGVLADIIKGGGLYSMLNVSLVVLISSTYSGIFEGTGLLKELEAALEKLTVKIGEYASIVLTSIIAASFGCTQTLAVILTHQFQEKIYARRQIGNSQLALDLENSVIVLSALIPWNIASAVPVATLSANAGCILYAFYLFLIPLVNLLWRKPAPAETSG